MAHINMPEPDQQIIARKREIVAELINAIGKEGVIHEPNETIAYECDALTAHGLFHRLKVVG